MLMLSKLLFVLVYAMELLRTAGVAAIFCYECTGGRADQTCGHYAGTSCEYGFFGCVKIVTYSGGVDKMGNFRNDPRSMISMLRGCNMLPVGGVDACQQQTILGFRILTCYCYSDYCNTATRPLIAGRHRYHVITLIAFSTLLFYYSIYFNNFLRLRQ